MATDRWGGSWGTSWGTSWFRDTAVNGTIGGIALLVETARPAASFVGGTTGSQALPVETARPNAKLRDT